MAGVTRLELATSCVTGKRSNQLSYTPKEKNCGENYKLKNKFFYYFFKDNSKKIMQNFLAKNLNLQWWVMTGSNCRPSPCKGDALPTELITQYKK